MQQNLIDFSEFNIEYALGDAEVLDRMIIAKSLKPFDDIIVDFIAGISRALLSDARSREYSDVVTLAFWMRKASVLELKRRFIDGASCADVIRFGRGIVFHIAPSNVPVNFAYSLVTGLLCGNRNIVRIPSKSFPQVDIVVDAISKSLEDMPQMKPYICLVRYGHDRDINDALSAVADVRIIWGGDNTINEIRKSALKPRATEVTFADRYSIVVIDSDYYLGIKDKARVAADFYNDTYLTDQNACTSPRAVIWMGNNKEAAKEEFWKELHEIAADKYTITGVQAVSKLASGYMLAAQYERVVKCGVADTADGNTHCGDNLITRMNVRTLSAEQMELKDNSGYFIEYDCDDIMDLVDICDDTRCQTLSYLGDKEMIIPLVTSGLKGIDRVVPIGKTMDFDLMWDGYNLVERLTRGIEVR